MAKIDVYNMKGEVTGSYDLNDTVFAVQVNEDLLHRAVLMQLANKRQGTHKVKGRSEVSGGGRKPYRQKGTGRARQGSIRAANHVGGGVIFGPVPRSYRTTMPKKMRRLAMKSALTVCVQDSKLRVLDELALSEAKTREMVQVLRALKTDASTLLILDHGDEAVRRASSNIPGLKLEYANTINVLDLMKHEYVVMTAEALKSIEEVYAS